MDDILANLTWAIGEIKKERLISGYKEIDVDCCLGNDGIYNILKGRVKEFNLKEISQYIYSKSPSICERMWQYISGHKNLSLKKDGNIPDYIPNKVRIILKMIEHDKDEIENIVKEMYKNDE